MSDYVRPHRRQPTRLPHPWDSPGKNTGVGCHFFLQCVKVKSESEVTQSSDPQRPHGLQPTRLLHPWDFPGKSTGVGCHCLLCLLGKGRCKSVQFSSVVSESLRPHESQHAGRPVHHQLPEFTQTHASLWAHPIQSFHRHPSYLGLNPV